MNNDIDEAIEFLNQAIDHQDERLDNVHRARNTLRALKQRQAVDVEKLLSEILEQVNEPMSELQRPIILTQGQFIALATAAAFNGKTPPKGD